MTYIEFLRAVNGGEIEVLEEVVRNEGDVLCVEIHARMPAAPTAAPLYFLYVDEA